MLAGETAVGAFPVQTVQTLDAVIRDAELVPPSAPVRLADDPTGSRHGRAMCEAAVTLATTGQADAIVAVTTEGKTARLLSALRPQAPILAATPTEEVAGRLTVCRGVIPYVNPESDVQKLYSDLLERELVRPGSVVVFINVSPELNLVDANFLIVQRA